MSTKKPSILSSFVRQIILLAIFGVLFLLGLRMFMKSYTNHGQSITVPDLRENAVSEIKPIIKKNKLKYIIEDSTFNADLAPGTIIDQNPKPNSQVKKNRTIYLIVNSSTPPPVKMPDLVGNSLRSATLRLENRGLKLGKKIYVPDIAKNAVLRQLHNGKSIEPNTEILKGEAIDLELGDGFGNTTMRIPDLVGLTYAEAIITLSDFGLTIGNVQQTDTVTDLNSATIYEQSPASVAGQTLEQGEKIDLYVTNIDS